MTKLLLLSILSILSFVLAVPLDSLNEPVARSPVRRASNESVSTAWYPSWVAGKVPPSKISWSKYNQMTFAFILTDTNSQLKFQDPSDETVLSDFVTAAKSNNVKALLSIGGWTGSLHFSSAVKDAASRTKFVKSVVDIATKHQLDGIDFDWEYPGRAGLPCNEVDEVNDTPNFLSFLQELRKDPVGSKLILTAAVGITPFSVNGAPTTDASGFADVLDHIAIMNYDIWGNWLNHVGPNAPLDDTCEAAANQQGSGVTAVKAWTAAGIPSNKLVLGVASYGRSFNVNQASALTNGKLNAFPAYDNSTTPLGEGETEDNTKAADVCGNPGGPSGIFYFEGLIAAGFLDKNGSAAAGIDYRFDECSKTPYVYNPKTQIMVSYDDATSFAAKGQFIKEQNLGGFAMWYGPGDSDDILVNAINGAISGSSSAPAPPSTGGTSTTGSGSAPAPTASGSAGHCSLRRRRSRRSLN